MLNEKRVQLEAIERRHGTKLLLIPNPHMETPHYDIEKIKDGSERAEVSHHLMVSPEPEKPEALKERRQVERPAVTGVSPAAPAPMINVNSQTQVNQTESSQTQGKPSLLTRLLNVLTGKSPQEENTVVEEQSEVVEQVEVKAEQTQRPKSRNNRNNGRKRNNNDAGSTDRTEQVKTDEQAINEPAKQEDEQDQSRNSNNRRSRRGGRRRRSPRNENETVIADDTGNKLPPEKKEVDGNALTIDDTPLPNGNVIADIEEIVVEVDGNKPAPAAKPKVQRKPSSNSPRRRRPSPPRNPQEKTSEPSLKQEENVVTTTDSGEVKPKPRRRAPRTVKPKEDAE
jgi:ribonuclease E